MGKQVAKQVAIVMTEVFLRRLTPALIPFVRRQHDFRILSIRRPVDELKALLTELNPSALITEWLPEVTEGLLELGIPTVITATDDQYPGVTSIDVNDWQVGAEAARAFAQAGYQSFACLGNATHYSDQRIEGFCRELGGSAQVSIHQEEAFNEVRYSEDFAQPCEALHSWLESLPKPVGIFAVHDPLGRFLCGVSREMGLRIPEEVAVIGANNDDLVCGLSYPMLSSVSIPWDTIGEAVGEAVRSLLSGEPSPSEPILVPAGGVVLRHSANHLAVEDPTLRRAMTYFSEHIQEPITIEILCNNLRIARRGLEQKFREYFHCTPWEMLCKLRVSRAKQLLTETNHPISIISELSGFNDPERMAVVFKRVEGMPPSAYRKGVRK
ncbi:MAG: LacI family transcriptional regulator [Rubritalea sp.]|jgi:LacI family transcriptional regulator